MCSAFSSSGTKNRNKKYTSTHLLAMIQSSWCQTDKQGSLGVYCLASSNCFPQLRSDTSSNISDLNTSSNVCQLLLTTSANKLLLLYERLAPNVLRIKQRFESLHQFIGEHTCQAPQSRLHFVNTPCNPLMKQKHAHETIERTNP